MASVRNFYGNAKKGGSSRSKNKVSCKRENYATTERNALGKYRGTILGQRSVVNLASTIALLTSLLQHLVNWRANSKSQHRLEAIMALTFSLLCFVSFASIAPYVVALDSIPIARCCADKELYSLTHRTCMFENSSTYEWPPPIYSTTQNRTLSVSDLKPLALSEEFENCTTDKRAFLSTQFKLYEDGTLKLPDGTHLKANEFCLSPVDVEGKFVARYCASDPCRHMKCVNKCCPVDMAINATTNKCQPNPLRFEVEFKNESGHGVQPSDRPFIISDGAPSCSHGMFELNVDTDAEDEFYILPDGRLYQPHVPEEERYTSEYCVENKVSDDSTEKLMALICFASNDQANAGLDDSEVIAIFPYFLFISSAFLIATFIVYLVLPRLRNVHGLTIMCYTVSLTTLYISLGLEQLPNRKFSTTRCIFNASVMHFAFLSSFTWLNVMSFDIWLTLKNVKPRRSRYGLGAFGKRFVYFSIYAWGVPLTIVSLGAVLQYLYGYDSTVITPSFSKNTCWFPRNETGPFWLYLYGPIGVLILANLAFFMLTLRILYQANVDNLFASNRARTKQKFRVILSLFFLMGISWAAEVISFAVPGSTAYIWLPFDIINILTGVFIFVIFVCKPNVWKMLKKKYAKLGACMRSAGCMKRQETYKIVRSSKNVKSMETTLITDGAANQPLCMAPIEKEGGTMKQLDNLSR